MRVESNGGLISIMDGGPDQALYLDPATKTAFRPQRIPPAPNKKVTGTFHPGVDVFDRTPAAKNRVGFSGFEKLKNIPREKAKPIGKKEIGGVRAQGFRVQQRGGTFTVWADPKSSLPLEIEQRFRAGNQEVTNTWTDFVFDARLDDSLFSLKLPAGYRWRED